MKDLKNLINEIPDYIVDLPNVDKFMKNSPSAKLKANKTTKAMNSSYNGNSLISTTSHQKNINNVMKLTVSENKFQQSANRSNENNKDLKEKNRIFEGGEEFQSGIVNKSNDSNEPMIEHKNFLQTYLSKFAKDIDRNKQEQMKKQDQNLKKLEQKNENKEMNKLLQNQETNRKDPPGGYDELKEKHVNNFLRFTPDFNFYKNNSSDDIHNDDIHNDDIHNDDIHNDDIHNDDIHNFLTVRPTKTEEEDDDYTKKRKGYLESKLSKANPHNYIRPYMTPSPTKSMMGKRTPTIPLLEVDDNWTQSTLKNTFKIIPHHLRNRVTLNCRKNLRGFFAREKLTYKCQR